MDEPKSQPMSSLCFLLLPLLLPLHFPKTSYGFDGKFRTHNLQILVPLKDTKSSILEPLGKGKKNTLPTESMQQFPIKCNSRTNLLYDRNIYPCNLKNSTHLAVYYTKLEALANN